MSLASRISDFITALGADIKALFDRSPPAGGTTGQVLTKVNSNDYNFSWIDAAGGAGITTTIPIVTAPNTTYTTLVGDAGKKIICTNAAAITLTFSNLPDQAFGFIEQTTSGGVITFASGTLTIIQLSGLTKTAGIGSIVFYSVRGSNVILCDGGMS